jgi:hypothetical protein
MGSEPAAADDFVKFPRTPHLFWLGDEAPRGDKLVDETATAGLLSKPVTVEEKVDGANLGLSVDPSGRIRAQNRGDYIDGRALPQFKPLSAWLAPREEALREALGDGLILFGEWCFARHTVAYDALPDWFLAFDVYDRAARRFWSRERREALVRRVGLASVPQLGAGSGLFDRKGIEKLVGTSRIGSVPVEGAYLRWDTGDWLAARAKLVRQGWVQPNEEHWSKRAIEPNRLKGSTPDGGDRTARIPAAYARSSGHAVGRGSR